MTFSPGDNGYVSDYGQGKKYYYNLETKKLARNQPTDLELKDGTRIILINCTNCTNFHELPFIRTHGTTGVLNGKMEKGEYQWVSDKSGKLVRAARSSFKVVEVGFKVGDRVKAKNIGGLIGVVTDVDKDGDPKIRFESGPEKGQSLQKYARDYELTTNTYNINALDGRSVHANIMSTPNTVNTINIAGRGSIRGSINGQNITNINDRTWIDGVLQTQAPRFRVWHQSADASSL